MIKAFILAAALLFLPFSLSWAGGYTSTLTILEKKDIVNLTDEQLTETYMDTLVDVEARKNFFNRFGFVGKELDEYKFVMKYRLVLLMEIHNRNLDIPQFDRY